LLSLPKEQHQRKCSLLQATTPVLPLNNLIDHNDMGYSKKPSACHCLTELIKSELCEDNKHLVQGNMSL
jgi:hypothetical protein